MEDEEEERKIDEYREIAARLKGYPDEDVRKAKKLVSSFFRAEEEVEEVIQALILMHLFRLSVEDSIS